MGRFDERAGLSRRGRDLTEIDGGTDGASGDAAGDAGFRRHDGGTWPDGEARFNGEAWPDGEDWSDGGAWSYREDWSDGGAWRDGEARFDGEAWPGKGIWPGGKIRPGHSSGWPDGGDTGAGGIWPRILLYAEAVLIGIFLTCAAIATLTFMARAISRLL